MLSFACYHVGKRPSSISDLFYRPPSDQQQPLMEGDLIGSYSELGSDEAVLLEQQYESDDAVLSDLSSIKTYSQDDYGEEELHGMFGKHNVKSLCCDRIRQQSVLKR